MFELHERLAADTVEVTRLDLCRLLLMGDARWPWLILVPQRAGMTGIHQLAPADRALLIEEVAAASDVLEAACRPDRINVGAMGNLVPQLHVHVIARHAGDPAWPGPVWGAGAPRAYAAADLDRFLSDLRGRFR